MRNFKKKKKKEKEEQPMTEVVVGTVIDLLVETYDTDELTKEKEEK